jgi:hypothetical protein
MLTLTRDAVGRVVRALITLEGETTTLDVKNKLRELGFFATQADVRNFMLDITSKEGDVQYQDGPDGYRIYKFRTPFPVSENDFETQLSDVLDELNQSGIFVNKIVPSHSGAMTIDTPLNPSTNTFPTVQSGVVKLHRDLVPADYIVTDPNGNYVRTYYDMSRREARSQWSKETGLHYFHARTTKL